MKKTLTILWIIIIAGTIFIAIHLMKLQNIDESTSETDEATENTTDIETDSTAEENNGNKTTEIIIEQTPAIISENTDKTFTEYLSAGDKYLSENYLNDAIENYKAAYYLSNYSEEAITKLANAYLLNNQGEEAKQLLLTANENIPGSEEIVFYLGKSYINTYDLESAKYIFWELNEAYPDNYEYIYYKAIMLTLGKDYEGSKDLFNDIIAAETSDELIENSEKFIDEHEDFSYYTEAEYIFLDLKLAKVLSEVEEYHASINLLYEILDEKNDYRDAWIVLGFSYLNTQQIAEAIDALEQARTITSNKAETLFFLGLAYYANEEVEKATYYIEQAEEAGYEDQEQIDLRLGELHLIQGNYEQSAEKYDQLLATNQKNIKIYIRTVWLYIDRLNKNVKALKIAKDSVKYHPEEEMSYNLLGWAYLANNKIEKAKENLNIALNMNPHFDAANLNFGILYEQEGLILLAKEYYKNAYVLGNGNNISEIAATHFNRLTEDEVQEYYKANISQP